MPVNKVDLSTGETLIDLTGDSVTPETLVSGATAHNRSGEQIVGTFTPNVNAGTATDIAGIIKGNGSTVSAAVPGTDYAPAYSGYIVLTAATTLSSTHYGKCVIVLSSSAVTITLPLAAISEEIEVVNIGAGTVTLSGRLRTGATTATSVTIESGDAVAAKWIGGEWLLIGNYGEA